MTDIASFRELVPRGQVFTRIRNLPGSNLWFIEWPDGEYTRAVSFLPDEEFTKRARIRFVHGGLSIDFPMFPNREPSEP